MRAFDVHKLTVESAGQTQEQGAVSIIGVVDPYDFRDAVLANAELLKQGTAPESSTARIDGIIKSRNRRADAAFDRDSRPSG